jgi:poly(3-hydroxybutyrate) depolymerase
VAWCLDLAERMIFDAVIARPGLMEFADEQGSMVVYPDGTRKLASLDECSALAYSKDDWRPTHYHRSVPSLSLLARMAALGTVVVRVDQAGAWPA